MPSPKWEWKKESKNESGRERERNESIERREREGDNDYEKEKSYLRKASKRSKAERGGAGLEPNSSYPLLLLVGEVDEPRFNLSLRIVAPLLLREGQGQRVMRSHCPALYIESNEMIFIQYVHGFWLFWILENGLVLSAEAVASSYWSVLLR